MKIDRLIGSLDSVSGSRYYGQLMEKIKTGSSEFYKKKNKFNETSGKSGF